MKIIEALKEIPLIVKKIEKNAELIRKYSSEVGTGENPQFSFGTKADQDKEVESLIQSTNDLVARKATLRKNLALTNVKVKVEIRGITRSIAEWIEYRQFGIAQQQRAYGVLDVYNADQQLKQKAGQLNITDGVRVYRFFDEKKKNDKLSELTTLLAEIDPALEMVNATTDLIEGV